MREGPWIHFHFKIWDIEDEVPVRAGNFVPIVGSKSNFDTQSGRV